VTVGIECHVQLKTATKLFSAAGNDAREAPANTLVNHIDFGLPGALPVLNKEAVHLASKAAFALNSKPQTFSKFDRKHYFYPDLPMGYQITQYDQPIVLGGSVDIEVDGQKKTIGITRAHLEADAGKSTHPAGKNYSLVDLNRAGTPLLEIVSEPDMHSSADAKAYARELYLRMKYADVSDANLYYGNMRFDVNVSVSKTDELGTRTETKNLNSFRAVEKAIEFEVTRQIERLEKGEKIIQETRGWDDDKQKTFSQRSKENADDYRYFPDPDIPPVVLDQKYIDDIAAEMPALPAIIRDELRSAGLDAAAIEALLDEVIPARFLYDMKAFGASQDHLKRVGNWFSGEVQALVVKGELSWEEAKLDQTLLMKLSDMVAANKLSSTAAKEVLAEMLKSGKDPEVVAGEKNLLQVSDEGEIAKIVAQVISENANAAEDVKNGEMKAIGFLVGQVMKLSQCKANPRLSTELIKKQLGL
jgi:aspartyl-tRNA(Asn)/glutamyl-tRNA(Gln) amidotransferase subunit B